MPALQREVSLDTLGPPTDDEAATTSPDNNTQAERRRKLQLLTSKELIKLAGGKKKCGKGELITMILKQEREIKAIPNSRASVDVHPVPSPEDTVDPNIRIGRRRKA